MSRDDATIPDNSSGGTVAHEAKVSMMIRKPVAEVFDAIVNPAKTSQFWFTKGSARLEKGKRTQWDWEMYGLTAFADVTELVPNERVRVEWSAAGQPATTVEWQFVARADGTTYVTVTNSGFRGTADEIVAQALNSTGGFAFHLAGMKAFLEHGINLNLVADHHPKS
jgi:uncharacterized protein YndB with AHSA1/START domain